MRVAFVTNICPHYRVKTFETLARSCDVRFCFYSSGGDRYWQQQHGVHAGEFDYEYLSGFDVGHIRIAPSLPLRLWRGHFDAYIKCINGRFALPVTYMTARLRHRPFILWTGLWMRVQTLAHRAFLPLTLYIYRHAAAVVVYGEHVKRYLISEGVAPQRIFVAPHATDNNLYGRAVTQDEKAVLRQKLSLPAERKIILYVGRLEKGKGLEYLLEAFARLQWEDVTLLIVGTGSQEEHLRALAHSYSIAKRVQFAGYVRTDELPPYYALAWAFVLPSVTTPTFKEPWGLVVNEAFNQGVPVIATDAVGAAAGGLVRDGVNGLIVPERDPQALADAMQRLLNNPDMRRRLAETAKADIAQWNNDRMVSGFTCALEYALSKHR